MSVDLTPMSSSHQARLAQGAYIQQFLTAMMGSLGIEAPSQDQINFQGHGNLPSIFPVSDFATAATGTAATAVVDLVRSAFGKRKQVVVDRRLSSLWFGFSIEPINWSLPSIWDPIAGDYRASDGWIRLHTNAPHHRAAAIAVLGCAPDKQAVSATVEQWKAQELETAITSSGGCAAAMRSIEQWRTHAHGATLAHEPLIDCRATTEHDTPLKLKSSTRPLDGIRVLDLTRVLAGPVATRFLAGLGADVLRIDPPDWDEPAVVPDVTLGKRCARLNLQEYQDRETLISLLRNADVLIHGYRADALEQLGLGAEVRRSIRPGLVDISLNAYGWTGPWKHRRGFDSLVQMSCGIADAGMRMLGKDKPTPLPVQALDHATGYLMAAAAIRGLCDRVKSGQGFEARTSLARVAQLLLTVEPTSALTSFDASSEGDWSEQIEHTDFGPVRRLQSPVMFNDMPLQWDRPATKLGSASAAW